VLVGLGHSDELGREVFLLLGAPLGFPGIKLDIKLDEVAPEVVGEGYTLDLVLNQNHVRDFLLLTLCEDGKEK